VPQRDRSKGEKVILEVVQAQFFATNCWIFAPGKNSECFIVDPGMSIPDLLGPIGDVCARHNLKPIATIVTHGHLDHTFSVKPLDDKYGLATYIHPKDREFLANPYGLLTPGGPTTSILDEMGVHDFAEPRQVLELSDGIIFEVAGFTLKAHHAPGHTPGSTVFVVNDEYLISGDVLFKNSIGNTSLLLGSESEMKKTLQKVILQMPDELIVLPGHGAETTIGQERRNNSYLQERYLRSNT
jgi:glyoxylase-like metal-dependent hydrolase (beta-lactamase superfamily II)